MGNQTSSNPPSDSVDRKFYIISRIDDNSVVHVENDSAEAGAKVIITPVWLDGMFQDVLVQPEYLLITIILMLVTS